MIFGPAAPTTRRIRCGEDLASYYLTSSPVAPEPRDDAPVEPPYGSLPEARLLPSLIRGRACSCAEAERTAACASHSPAAVVVAATEPRQIVAFVSPGAHGCRSFPLWGRHPTVFGRRRGCGPGVSLFWANRPGLEPSALAVRGAGGQLLDRALADLSGSIARSCTLQAVKHSASSARQARLHRTRGAHGKPAALLALGRKREAQVTSAWVHRALSRVRPRPAVTARQGHLHDGPHWLPASRVILLQLRAGRPVRTELAADSHSGAARGNHTTRPRARCVNDRPSCLEGRAAPQAR